NVPPDLDQSVSNLVTQLGDQLFSLSIPFPTEAVGVGGRWRATSELTLNGVKARQVYEYTLRKRAGGKLVIGVTGTQTAGRQTVEPPTRQAGGKAEGPQVPTACSGGKPGRL